MIESVLYVKILISHNQLLLNFSESGNAHIAIMSLEKHEYLLTA